MTLKTSVYGDQNIGLYGYSTDKYCIMGSNSKANVEIKKALKVPVKVTNFMGTDYAGIFSTGNSKAIITAKIVGLSRKIKGIDVIKVDSKYTAIGNLILMNDNGIILSPLLKKHKIELKKEFDIPVEISKIAGLQTVGSCGITTNKGCALHPEVKKTEIKIIEDVLGVESKLSTVGFGSYYVKSGAIANSKGLVVSEKTTGIELGQITEALDLI